MEIILGALAEAIFGVLIADLAQRPRLHSIREKLQGDSPEKLALQRALASTYLKFTQKFHDLSSSLFDEFFLQKPVIVSELTKLLTPNQTSDLSIIAEAWSSQFSFSPKVNLEEPITYFISSLQEDIKSEALLKPFVDSRAFDQLYSIAESSSSQARLQSETNSILESIRSLLSHAQNNYGVSYFSGASFVPAPTIPINGSNLPNKHPNFIGRKDELRDVITALGSRAWIVSIDGIGGVGKTTLALEVAHRIKNSNPSDSPYFEGFVWISARGRPNLQLDDVVQQILYVLSPHETRQRQIDHYERQQLTLRILSSKSNLLIVDNFETVTDESLLRFLSEMPSPSKVLITSRHHLRTGEKVITLGGLDEMSAINILRAEAARLGIGIPKQDTAILRIVAKKTFGIPFILRWVMEMIHNGKTLEWALESLENATSDDIFDYIFAHSLSLVDESTKSLFYSMYFVLSWADIKTISAINPNITALQERLSQLISLSLLEDNRSLVTKNRRYQLPLLARYLVANELDWTSTDATKPLINILRHYISEVKVSGKDLASYLSDQLSNFRYVIEMGSRMEPHVFELCSELAKAVTDHDQEKGQILFQYLVEQTVESRDDVEELKLLESLPNPYIVGAPIRDISLFFGRENVIQRMRENFEGRIIAPVIALHGERRIGKTSLLYQLQQMSSNECLYILVDFQAFAGSEFGAFLYGLTRHIIRQLGSVDSSINLSVESETFLENPQSRFFDVLDQLTEATRFKRIVLMFDEFEALFRFDLSHRETNYFLNALRSMVSHKDSIGIITSGVMLLHELPGATEGLTSPFFNIAMPIRLSFLTKQESFALIQKPTILRYEKESLEYIFALTAGHPFLIQLVCSGIVNYCNTNKTLRVTSSVVENVVQEAIDSGHIYFNYIFSQYSESAGSILKKVVRKFGTNEFSISEAVKAISESEITNENIESIFDQFVYRELLVRKKSRFQLSIELLYKWLMANE